MLTSPKKGETAVHCYDPALSVRVVLVSRNVFHVVSALQSIVCLHTFFWLIRSLVDPVLKAFIVLRSLAVSSFFILTSQEFYDPFTSKMFVRNIRETKKTSPFLRRPPATAH